MPADFITAQIDAVFSDLDVDAVKIGMLSQAASIEAVAKGLADHRAKNIVLDPVMVATSGDRLLARDAVDALAQAAHSARARRHAQSAGGGRAARRVTRRATRQEMEIQARELLALGARKRADQGRPRRRATKASICWSGRATSSRLVGQAHRHQEHRTAPAARCRRRSRPGWPRGSTSRRRCREAKAYVTGAIAAADQLAIGHGHGPLHHFSSVSGETHDHATRHFTDRRRPRRRRCSPRPRSRARRRRNGAWSRPGRSGCRAPACRPSASPSASARCRAAGSTSPCHAAGEVVPAFEVLDAVGNGVAEIGHTASFYWQGKMPAAAFFTTVPFGLTPNEHVAWVDAGGGQALWDELYAPFGVKPFMGGNTGVCMGGWFRREIKSLADVRGLKMRSLGLGGEVYRRLGATPQTTPPAEILTSLQSGVIDGAEFVGPGTDIALGLYRVAPFYYYPGFNKPNGTGECIVSLKAWNALDPTSSRRSSRMPARRRPTYALAEMERLNAAGARARWSSEHNVKLAAFPEDLIAAARKQARRRAGRTRRQERHHRQGACVLRGVPRTHRALVAGVDRVGAAGAGCVIFREML